MSDMTAFVKEYFDWATEAEKDGHKIATVSFRMTTNNRIPNGPHSFASYAEGFMNFDAAKVVGGKTPFLQGARFFSGPVDQLFSDRRSVVKHQQFGDVTTPFDPKKPDKIELIIQRSPIFSTSPTLTATIKMVTWGNNTVQFNLDCKAGLLVGAIDDNTICTISFNGKSAAVPPK